MNCKVLLILSCAALAVADSRERYFYRPPRFSAEDASREASSSSVEVRPIVRSSGSSEEFVYRAPRASSEESSRESYESSEAQYAFNYAVKDESSENDFGHAESREGDHTQGSYYVHLPDSRLQKVTYRVEGDSGYVADVSYEGEAQFPESYERYESNESDESFEVRRYTPPRRVFTARDSNESDESVEVPRFTTPRPRRVYSAPDSDESFEAPRRVYAAPDSNESFEAPRIVYGVPDSNESVEAPRRVYGVPDSNESVEAPRRAYGVPDSNESF
ncbi:uncharacterized protein LOC135194880 [Macrobrachium nipponense]|uniref:uncharacterized protein LOC135194880 n=1 Tax=Macrobrachium nipponense TaxID=159736 RepID=UPI0030C87572